jgi:hypothetical protein
MAKKVQVCFELDLDAAKELAASNKSATRRVSAADLEKLAEHGQVNAAVLFGKQELGSLVATVSKMRQFPDFVPTYTRIISTRFEEPRPPARFRNPQVMFRAEGPVEGRVSPRGRRR